MNRPGTHRTWLYTGIALALVWILYLSWFGPRRRAILENSALDQPAAYDWTLFDLADQPVAFAAFRNKPVFLNIWATWCGPCVAELPSIAELARDPELAGADIEFVCVSIDEQSETVRRFLQGRGWKMTFLRAEKLPAVFATDGIPATFIIAPDGRIVASEIGSADWHEPRVVAFLKRLPAKAGTGQRG
jgi:thiol-disulfide isomerase/thioredoxin